MVDSTSTRTLVGGRYQVVGPLGRGSMGRVVAVRDTHAGGAPLACKILEVSELREDLVAELLALREVNHAGFVTGHRLGFDRQLGVPFALLELCQGPSLAEAAPPDPAAAAVQLLRALDHLHRLGRVHGDVAPTNIVWRDGPEGGLVKLLDLGAGGVAGSRAGSTSGTLAFVAPERLQGDALDPRGDLWSLGASLFHFAHGRHPWPAYPARDGGTHPPDRTGLRAHVLDPLLDHLLRHEPGERPASATAALATLEGLTGRVAPLVPPEDATARLRTPPYVDVDGALADLARRIITRMDASQPVVARVAGASGAGRSRILQELRLRLAARGVEVIASQALPGDAPGAPIARLLARLGAPAAGHWTPDAALRALTVAVAQRAAPVALTVDDVDRADAFTQAVVDAAARSVAAAPDRYKGVVMAVVSGSAQRSSESVLRLRPWDAADVEALLGLLFPGRPAGSRVVGPLTDHARGNPALLLANLRSLIAQGHLHIDATNLALAPGALEAGGVGSRDAVARGWVAGLAPAVLRGLRDLAFARVPLPEQLLEPSIRDALRDAGVAAALPTRDGARWTPSSEAVAAAAREGAVAREIHQGLAARWAAADAGKVGLAHALWHRLRSGEDAAQTEAAAAVMTLSAELAAPVILALRAHGFPFAWAQACHAAEVLQRTGSPTEAAACWERATALAADDVEAVRALIASGRLEAQQSRHAAAHERFARALARSGDALPDADRAALFEGLARSAVMTGKTDAAGDWAREGLRLGATLAAPDRALLGRLRYSLGLVQWYQGAVDEASQTLTSALEDTRAAGDLVEEAAVVTALGLVAYRRGELDEARGHYHAAMALGERAGDDARVLTALQNLGVVYHERGDWTAALDTYREALALAEALGQTGRAVQLAGNIGNLWRYLGELDEARSILLMGLERARAEDNRYMEGVLLNLLADVAADEADCDAAERLWRDAIRVASGASCAAEEAEARVNLAALLAARQSFAEARRTAAVALSTAEGAGNASLAVQARSVLADIERQRPGGDLAEADTLMNTALGALDAVPNPGARWPILQRAALLARDHGDFETARLRASEVLATLERLADTVPGRHRNAYQARRDRVRATREMTALAAAGKGGDDTHKESGWARLLDINKRLATEHDVTQLLAFIMDSAIALTEAERGFVLLSEDGDTGEDALEVRVARNLDQENVRKKRLKISRGIARRVIDSGEATITIDAMEDERYRDQLSVHDLRLRSIMCLPMGFRGRVLGAIYLDNRFRASAFSADDLPFMEAFSDLAAIALANAQLLDARAKSQAALVRSQQEVEALNTRLSDQLEARTQELAATHRVVIRQRRQLVQKNHYGSIIGESPAIRRVFAMMDRLLDNDVAVLIEGESGTGKELVARAIHFNGARAERPFVAVNCGAIPGTLLESELFGHVRGAFTGATSDKKGLFEAAHRGTLLLDEIGELPLEMQVKLLRVLQSGDVRKVGAARDLHVDVRILAATNRTLEDEVKAGRFREDLYYRLSVVPLVIPPLRERREDIPMLVQHFLDANRKAGLGAVTGISHAALALLQAYDWPGNIRQLEMVLKNASVFAEGGTLQPQDLESFAEIMQRTPAPSGEATLRGRTLADIEREAIIVALRDNRGNKKRSAEQLGIDRRTLYNKLAAYKIVVEKELTVH